MDKYTRKSLACCNWGTVGKAIDQHPAEFLRLRCSGDSTEIVGSEVHEVLYGPF